MSAHDVRRIRDTISDRVHTFEADVGILGELDDPVVQRLRHDLRQPLAAITWSVEAITRTSDLPPHLVAALDQIGQQAHWMNRLLTSMLDEGGDIAVVDLAKVVAGPCSTTPPTAAYQVRFPELAHAPVLVDPVDLERATRNLMDNATRAVAEGGQVEVRVRADDRQAVLEVADSGPGFGSLAPQHGHGLVGVRRFAERFGGDFVCSNSSLGGALVSLRLPLAFGW